MQIKWVFQTFRKRTASKKHLHVIHGKCSIISNDASKQSSREPGLQSGREGGPRSDQPTVLQHSNGERTRAKVPKKKGKSARGKKYNASAKKRRRGRKKSKRKRQKDKEENEVLSDSGELRTKSSGQHEKEGLSSRGLADSKR